MAEFEHPPAHLVDAELIHDPLHAGPQLVVAVAGLLEHPQCGLDGGEQFLASREVLEGHGRMRCGPETTGDVHTETCLDGAVIEGAGHTHSADVIEHGLAAVGGTAREVDLELAGKALTERIAHEVAERSFGPWGDVELLVWAGPREVAGHHVSHGVAAGLTGGEIDLGQAAQEVGDLGEFHVMELDVLPGGDVAPTAGELIGQHAHEIELFGGDGAGREFDAHHLVGAALTLAVDAVVEAHHPEHVLGDLLGEVLGDGDFEPLDIGLLFGVEVAVLGGGDDRRHDVLRSVVGYVGESEKWSAAMVLADLAQGIVQGASKAAGMVGVEVHDDSGTGQSEFLDSENDARLGVVVVVADGHGPGHRRGILGTFGQVGCSERLIIDGAAHVSGLRR